MLVNPSRTGSSEVNDEMAMGARIVLNLCCFLASMGIILSHIHKLRREDRGLEQCDWRDAVAVWVKVSLLVYPVSWLMFKNRIDPPLHWLWCGTIANGISHVVVSVYYTWKEWRVRVRR